MKAGLWERFSKWITPINIDETEDYKNGKEKLKKAFPNVEINKIKEEATEGIDVYKIVEEAKNNNNGDVDDADDDADGIYDVQQQEEREEAESGTESQGKQTSDNQQQ